MLNVFKDIGEFRKFVIEEWPKHIRNQVADDVTVRAVRGAGYELSLALENKYNDAMAVEFVSQPIVDIGQHFDSGELFLYTVDMFIPYHKNLTYQEHMFDPKQSLDNFLANGLPMMAKKMFSAEIMNDIIITTRRNIERQDNYNHLNAIEYRHNMMQKLRRIRAMIL